MKKLLVLLTLCSTSLSLINIDAMNKRPLDNSNNQTEQKTKKKRNNQENTEYDPLTDALTDVVNNDNSSSSTLIKVLEIFGISHIIFSFLTTEEKQNLSLLSKDCCNAVLGAIQNIKISFNNPDKINELKAAFLRRLDLYTNKSTCALDFSNSEYFSNFKNIASKVLINNLPVGTRFPAITSLDVSRTDATPEIIFRWLQACPNLRLLDIQHNHDAAQAILNLPAETRLHAIKELNLSYTEATPEIIARWLQACPNLQELYLSNNPGAAEAILNLPAEIKLPAMRTLNLSYTRATPEIIVRWLQACPKLQSLNIYGNYAAAETILNLPAEKKLPAIKELNLSYTTATPEVIARWLQACPNLQSLNIFCNNRAAEAILALPVETILPAITNLDLRNTSASATTIAAWRQACPNLKSFNN